MPRRPETFDTLPLFAPDAALSVVLMGPGKAVEWRQAAALLELEGLPKIDHLMGGRYVPAVRRFFEEQHGHSESRAPVRLREAGIERLGAWQERKNRRRQA